MTTLAELGLTPTQHAEIDQLDDLYVQRWLNATDDQRTTIKSPAAWFLAGIRSGRNPNETTDADKAKATHLAEIYIRNAGLYLPPDSTNPNTSSDLIDTLFGPYGKLKSWADDQQLRERMLDIWRDQQPRAQAADQDRLDRAQRFREAREPMTANPPTPPPEHT